MMKEKKQGGFRPGSGRKKIAVRKIEFLADEATDNRLKYLGDKLPNLNQTDTIRYAIECLFWQTVGKS